MTRAASTLPRADGVFRRRLGSRWAWLVAGLFVFALAGLLPGALKALDRHLAGEPIRNFWGLVRWQEDWSSARHLPAGLDSQWLERRPAGGLLRIAHALGASGSPEADTLSAFAQSRAEGFLLFEVDVWLDSAGRLRCFHGPDDGAESTFNPPPLQASDCTLDSLLKSLAEGPGWLVLDIKTDFERTGARIVERLRGDDLARRVVFQLYRPAHLALFAAWATAVPLPAPIVTVYAAHRGVQHIADQLPMLGVRALTLPLPRAAALQHRPTGVVVLMHPVHDCAAQLEARLAGADGIYTLSGMRCP